VLDPLARVSQIDGARAVANIPFFSVLPSDEAARIGARGRLHVLARGEQLWDQGAQGGGFGFVHRGRLKMVQRTAEGRETILELRGPGELLCMSAVCMYRPYCCAPVALEDGTEVLVVPRIVLLDHLERHPDLAQAFSQAAHERQAALCRRIGEMSGTLVEQRIAALLLRLCDDSGVARPGGGRWIPLALSRQDLADLVGTTVETAIRTMTRLARDGIVRSVARGFVVHDRGALQALARGEGRRALGEPGDGR